MGVEFFLKGFSRILNILPERIVRFFSWMFGEFLFSVLRFRRRLVQSQLEKVYGQSLSADQIQSMMHENYQHYSKICFEILSSITWTREKQIKQTEVQGLDEMLSFSNIGQGGFILTSHLGNWEAAIAAVSVRGLPVDVVVKKPRTPRGEELLYWYRTRWGAGVLYETGTVREILRSVTNGRFAVFVLDQFMGPPIGLPVTFFGQLAGTAVGLSLLTEKREVPIFTAFNFRNNHGKLCTVLKKVEDQPLYSENKEERLYQKTQFYNDLLEAMIRRQPEQWLWLHRRWKEYRGEPRWQLKRALVSFFIPFFLLLNLAGCASAPSGTETGITLPPDPNIGIPEFTQNDETAPVANKNIPGVTVMEPEVPSKTKKGKKPAKPPVDSSAIPNTVGAVNTPTTSVAPSKAVRIIPVDRVPFEIGERMEIDLTWVALPAGRAMLEVREGQDFNGRKTYQLWGNVLSSKLVDTIYHVDNTIESFIDKEGFIPYKFKLSMLETHQTKETRVSFDHTKGKAYYWAKRISEKWGNQDIDRADDVAPQSRDMFAALYYARSINYTMGKKERFRIYENGQNMDVELTPVGNELITSKAGAFQCWKLKVDVRINNVLSPTGDLFLWLSDDSRKYIVRFDAKVKIGSLYGNLVSVREH